MIGVVKRGEVCWVSIDGSVGTEIQTGRPAVILSSDVNNAKLNTVSVAFLSTGYVISDPSRVNVTLNGKPQKVLCDQHRSVDKQRLTKRLGMLTEEDMKRVTSAMAAVLCIPIPHNTPKVEYSTCDSDEIEKLKVELDIMKGMYSQVLDQLVKMKVDADVASRLVESVVVENEDMPIDDSEIDDIEVEDSVVEEESVPEEQAVFTGKVNINTCTAKEIADALGIHINFAYGITGYRKVNGNYVCVEEVMEIKRLPKNFLERFGDRLTVGDDEPSDDGDTTDETSVGEGMVDEPSDDRLDINTASTRDFMRVGFDKRTSALITSTRKKFGKFRNVEDLSEIDGVSGKIMRKLSGVLYVGDSKNTSYWIGR